MAAALDGDSNVVVYYCIGMSAEICAVHPRTQSDGRTDNNSLRVETELRQHWLQWRCAHGTAFSRRAGRLACTCCKMECDASARPSRQKNRMDGVNSDEMPERQAANAAAEANKHDH